MKKCIKILCILIVLIEIVFLFQTVSFAADLTTGDTNLDGVINGMKDVNNGSTGGQISKVINGAIRLLQVAGTGISVIVVTMLGVKYMLASSNEKADIKKMAVPIIIGCVLLFGAVNLVSVVASVGDSLN